MKKRTFYLAFSSLLLACGGSQTVSEPANEEEIVIESFEFDPMIIRAGIDDDGEVWSAETDLPALFAEANDYLNADDYLNAIELYEIIVDESVSEDYQRAAHYNLGLAHEGLEQWLEAARYYQIVLQRWARSHDAAWSYYRLAECLANLGEFRNIPMLMERVLERMDLAHIDRMEAHLRWANALLELRIFPDAALHYEHVIERNEAISLAWNPENSRSSDRPLPNHDPIVAQAYFGRARVFHELFSDIQFVLPQDRIRQDLIDKTQLFDQAQDAYLDCVRTAHRYWAPAAGFMIGQLFEDYYADLLASEVPVDFDELTLQFYFEELRALAGPAMERAMGIYEHTLAMSYRLNSNNMWVEDTLSSIHRVQNYIINQQGWEAEHELIVQRRHPHSAFYTEQLIFRSDRHRMPTE